MFYYGRVIELVVVIVSEARRVKRERMHRNMARVE
jgi:hypothetical protein